MPEDRRDNLQQTAEIVAAYARGNPLPAAQLPLLIQSVHAAVAGLGGGVSPAPPPPERASSAEIRRSIRPDTLVSFIDGRPYRTLRRHLGSHDLTPESYRKRYGLPADYPMVARSYAAARSALARKSGLGRRGR